MFYNANLAKYWPFMSIMIAGILLRLICLDNPLTEAWNIRQAQTAMMARNIFQDGISFLPTRLDFFGNVNGEVVLEFPLMHFLTAILYSFIDVDIIYGRLVSLLFSIFTFLYIYRLANLLFEQKIALLTLFFYVISPWNIYLNRAFMPEASVMLFYTASVYYVLDYIKSYKVSSLLLGMIFLAIAPMLKPPAGIAHCLLILMVIKHTINFKTKIFALTTICLSALPFLGWAVYANLINSSNVHIPSNWGNWFDIIYGRGGILGNWLSLEFYKNVGGSLVIFMITPIPFIFGLIFLFTGKRSDEKIFLIYWVGICMLFTFILAGANRGHPYYQIFFLPPMCLMASLGCKQLWPKIKNFVAFLHGRLISLSIGFLYVLFYLWFFNYMYDPTRRMPHAIEVSDLVKSIFPDSRFALIHQINATSGVLDYYIEGKSLPINLKNEAQAIAMLHKELSNGANIFVSINTSYGNSLDEFNRKTLFKQALTDKIYFTHETDSFVVYGIKN